MKKYTMRNYLKARGINLNKAKSWTLGSTSEKYADENLFIRSWIDEQGRLWYVVKQGKVIVKFQGSCGMEEVKSYSDSKISFIVDSVANDISLQVFVGVWVAQLRKGKYKGSWTLKKERKAMKEKQYQGSFRTSIKPYDKNSIKVITDKNGMRYHHTGENYEDEFGRGRMK